jgi:protein-tyrosine phosphatase
LIDLHFHLLPGIDDGPQSDEEMLDLARAAHAAGTRTVVATPHLDEHWDVEVADVAAGVVRARAMLVSAGIELEVLPGAEVSLPRLMTLDAADRATVLLGGGSHLLLESPHSLAAGDFDGAVERLLEDGQPVVLAHPERCPLFQRRIETLERLVDAGALCSITAASLAGKFGRPVREVALDMLGRGLVHDVASDAHGAQRRGPDLLGAFAAAGDEFPGLSDHAAYFTQQSPAAILAGRTPADPPALERRPGRGRRLRLFARWR